jgi:hypothetical protein
VSIILSVEVYSRLQITQWGHSSKSLYGALPRSSTGRHPKHRIAAVVGLALIIFGAEITLRGDSARRAGGKAKAHQYRAHPPFH